ncbi:hypothetical protein C6N75_15890 [Streptomyces solincola]|uniref:Uncharacterized protein n=2 Tax=Streptomyces solincola TaxID=2100817 RepID=A0A2S9PUY1_9ACTN|nr:hypothetical protein C6N75_15890 [Streptomyces solincola]
MLAVTPAQASYHTSKPKGWGCDFDGPCSRGTKSGPKEQKILYWFLGDSKDTVIRAGSSKYGMKHIKAGGTHARKFNHPTDKAAMALWDKALSNQTKGSWGHRFPNTTTHTAQYGGGASKRTMCVITSELTIGKGATYVGLKGIITAYWVNGHVGWRGCNNGRFD